MKVLDYGATFNVSGYSSPNFLAWNTSITSAAVTFEFPTPVSGFQLKAGTSSVGSVTVSAYDSSNVLLHSSVTPIASALTTVVVPASSVSRVTFSATSSVGVIDDVSYFELFPEMAVFKGAVTDPELTDNTGTQDFGSVNVGSSSAAQTFTIRNDGTADLTGIAVTKAVTGNPGDFTLNTTGTLTTLAPNATTTFTVTFSPAASGARSAVINIASNDADENPFEINVGGTGTVLPPSQLVMPPQTSNYSPQARGYWFTAPTDMTITGLRVPTDASTGNQSIAVVKFNSAVPFFSSTSNDFTVLYLTQNNPDSGVLSVSIPIVSGSIIGVLGVRGSGVNSYASPAPVSSSIFGIPVTLNRLGMQFSLETTAPQQLFTESGGSISRVDLYATAGASVTAPEIAVHDGATTADPELTDAQVTPVAFGNTNLGATTTRTFTVANTGGADLTLGAITIDGPDAADFSVTTAPTSPVTGPTGTTTFVVTFAPLTAGTKTAALHLVNNDADENPFDINLSGFGVLSPPIVVTSGSAGITAYTATVSGTVNPNYGASSAWFEYSTDPTLTTGVLSTPVQAIPYGFTATGITANLANLLAEQPYYFRAVASNDAGTTNGNILSFTTSYPVATDDSFDASTGLVGGGDIYRPVPGVINADGRISFRASLLGGVSGVSSINDAIVLSDSSGTLRVIAQEGNAVPGGGTLGGFFQYPILTPAGLTVVRDRFSGVASTVDYAYLASEDGILTGLLSREGDTAPNGGVFTGHAGQPSADDQERVYFNGALSGVATTRNSGIWYDAGGTISKLVQEGENVSTLIGDPAWLGNISPTTSAAGDGVAFVAALQKNPANKLQTTAPARNQALIGGAPGSLAVIARKGDVIPGVGKIKSFTGVSRSSAGDHAFMSALTITTTAPAVSKLNDQVLLAKIGPIVHVVAREGTTEVIPASGLRTARVGHFYAAGDGSVLFLAWVAGSGVTTANDGVLCRWTVADGIEVLAREGDAAPGTGSTYTAFTGFSVSPGGAVALTATLANKRIVLLRALAGDDLSFVTQTTENISYNGAPRKILSLGIHDTGTGAGHGGNGKGAAINDEGDVFSVLSIGGGEYIARIFKLP
jgi:hypothetical protein